MLSVKRLLTGKPARSGVGGIVRRRLLKMPKPWKDVPINSLTGVWTKLMDVLPETGEVIVAVTVFKGKLVVATNRQVLIYTDVE